MKFNRQIDLTVGNPLKCIILFAIPLYIESIINLLYNTVDSVIIGQIILEQFARITDTTNLIAIATFFISACATGFGALVGYFYGAKSVNKTRETIAKSFTLSLIIGVILQIIMVSLLNPLLKMLNLSPDINYNTWYTARCYAFVIFLGLPITILSNTMIFSLRNIGDTVFPLITSIFSGFLNALLTFLCVYFIDDIYWKVRCAAIATIASQLFKFIICLIYAKVKYESFRCKKTDFLLDQNITKRFLANSIPIGLEWAIIGFGLFFVSSAIVSFDNAQALITGATSNDAQNAYGSAIQIRSYMVAIGSAIMGATLSFTSQNYGAKQYLRLKNSFKQIELLVIITYIIMYGLMMLLTINGAFLYIFLNPNNINERIIKYGFYILLINGGFLIFKTYNDIYSKALIGLEKPLVPSIIGFVELAIRLLLVLVIRNLLEDPNGLIAFIIVISAEPTSWIASCLLSTITAKKHLKALPNENYQIVVNNNKL